MPGSTSAARNRFRASRQSLSCTKGCGNTRSSPLSPWWSLTGIGLTGARTHVFVDPPDPYEDRINSPVGNADIRIEIRVVAVRIDWGDGAISTIPESQFKLFAPHPDGEVGHPWETTGHYDLSVDYEWLARWRVGNGTWRTIDIPNTVWESPYRVDEVVGRRSG